MVRKGSAPPTAKDPADVSAAADGLATSSSEVQLRIHVRRDGVLSRELLGHLLGDRRGEPLRDVEPDKFVELASIVSLPLPSAPRHAS
jgi:hypothetical protein